MKILKLILLFPLILWGVCSMSQSEEKGLPYIKNFPTKEIITSDNKTVGTQFWDIAQDNNGRMYFGNSSGILIYDGKAFDMLLASNETVIRSIDVDKTINRVYIGAQDDIGYLKTNASGNLQFHSLLELIPEGNKKFGNVWKTYVTDEGVFFQTFSHIFLLKNNQIKVFKPKSSFHLSFYVNNTFIVLDRKHGLYTLKDNELRPLPEGDFFKGKRIYAVLSLDEASLLLCSRQEGLFLYKNNSLSPFKTSIDDLLKTAQIYNGLKLSDNTYVIASVRNGLIHLDKNGKILNIIDKESGLQDNGIFSLYEDSNNGVWTGLNNGIARIELMGPVTFFNEKNGLKGKGQCLARYKDKIFIGTSLGLYYMDKAKSKSPGKAYTFTSIPKINTATWRLQKVGDGLLIAASQGLYFWKNQKLTELFKGYALNISRSKIDKNRFYIGTLNGVIPVFLINGQWKTEPKLPGVEGQISGTVETKDKDLWVSVRNRKLIRIDLQNGYEPENFKIYKYRKDQGLSPTGSIAPFDNAAGLVFSTDKGFYRFDKEKELFYPDTTLSFKYVEDTQQAFRLRQDKQGFLWTGINSDPIQRGKFENGKILKWTYKPFLTLPQKATRDIISDDDGTVWFACVEGLYRYDGNTNYDINKPYQSIIKKVRQIKDDAIIYGGYNFSQSNNRINPKIDYDFNSMFFEFIGPSYPNENEVLFRYQLKGFDTDWSVWKSENKKEFTNLPAGDYTFKVEAKNIFSNISSKDTFSFTILPPWYQTTWAYLLFTLGFVAVIVSSVKYYNRRLQAENEKLEVIVSQRTAQLREEKEIVESQKEEILQQNRAISLQKEEIETQKDNLETQKNEVEKAYNNINILSEIGRKITATLKVESIIFTVYDYINTLMDASAFGLGIYNPISHRIEFDGFIEKGNTIPYNYDKISDEKSLSVWCFQNKKEIFINNLNKEYHNYIDPKYPIAADAGEIPESIIYLPLILEGDCIGVITVQSFKKESYTERDKTALSTLASYIVIALDNAKAYHIIHTKNQHITDSIRYARTIQKAILPSMEMLNTHLKDFFVIYKPKDIVSGDFYWASAVKDDDGNTAKIFVAVADCTGHGVPGGFMSMISSTLINEIINIKKIHAPDEVLEILDQEIRKALNQEKSDNNDGLDLALCCIEKSENGQTDITFCGAKRPIYYTNSETEKLEEIKGTSRGIGGTQKIIKQPFISKQISLKQGEAIYLSTDGLIDQPNPSRKRFGSIKLKKALLKSTHLPMKEQQELLLTTIEEYQKDTDQRDDIAILGIRI